MTAPALSSPPKAVVLPDGLDGRLLRSALSEAAESASGQSSALRKAAVAILKPAWLQAREAILARLEQRNPNGTDVARALSACADVVVTALWDFTHVHVYRARNPTEGERLTLLAVGGYGRGEMAPFSDLDLLFLRAWKETPHGESVIEFMLYALWDMGFKVGWASRTIDETLKLAQGDHTIQTGLLECRFLAGDADMAATLQKRIQLEARKTDQARTFAAAKLSERDARHAKTGATRFVVEPNVKDGKGGLRDLNTLFWIARSLHPDQPSGQAALDPLLTPEERRTFASSLEHLWRVRIHLHQIAGRAEERLTFDRQPEIAARMGYRDRGDSSGVERFMRRYFMTAKEVGALTRTFCAKLEADHAKVPQGLSRFLPGNRTKARKLDIAGLVVDGGRLSVENPDVFRRTPALMMRLFQTADRMNLDLHPDAFTAVHRNLGLIKPAFRRDPAIAQIFLDILARGRDPYRTLSLMVETGLLGRYIPEFGQIVAQTQFNMYHAYTVDEHTLRAIGIIKDIERGRFTEDHPLASSILPRIANKETLYLAMLLHDVGKGGAEGQEIGGEKAARKAGLRLGLPDWKIDEIAWLVRHHLVLSDYAQKRDVRDPDTVASFARIVETPERLRLLLVLTVADIRAVGPGVWNGWKGQLMRELYAATEAAFRGGRGHDPAASVRAELHHRARDIRTQLTGKDTDLAHWLGVMEDAYLCSFSEADLRRHARIVTDATVAGARAEGWIDPARNAAALVVATRDRPGLFADLAGIFAPLGASVVGAQVYTSRDGWALDVFYVQDQAGDPFGADAPERLAGAVARLETAALGLSASPQSDPGGPRLLPPRFAAFAIAPTVVFDSEASDRATVVEVSGRDRPGLLAELARVLARSGLSIESAHIGVYGERAVDAFYLVDPHTPKPWPRTYRQTLRAALNEVLDPPLAVPEVVRARASRAE